MAFNPFHGFRKHRRVIFAVLTIICMITFILSGGFGRGDALESLMNLFGRGNKRGDVVTVLHGEKIYSGEIGDYSAKRRIANEFARRSINENTRQSGGSLAFVVTRPMPTNMDNPDLMLFRFQVERVFFGMLALGRAQLSEEVEKALIEQMGRGRLEQRRRNPQEDVLSLLIPERINEQRTSFMRLRSNLVRKNMTEELKVVDTILSMFAMDLWERSSKDPRGALIFGGTTSQQDTLDFIMWLKQADTLGIKLTDSDIRTVLNRLTTTRPMLSDSKAKDQESIRELYKQDGREAADIDVKTLYRALANELRVALAQGVVLGEEPGILGYRANAFREPLAVTPLQYVDYYREQRQTAQVVLLPVPASAFAAADLPQPTARQIEELYEEYKNVEPMPWSPSPAFKIPQRVRLQWISARTVEKTVLWNAGQVLPLAGHIRVLEDPRVAHFENRAQQKLAVQIASSAAMTALLKDPWQVAATGKFHEPSAVTGVIRSINSAYDGLRDRYPLPSLFDNDPSLAFATAANFPAMNASAAVAFAPGASPGLLTGLFAWQGSAVLHAGKSQDALLKEERANRSGIAAGLAGSAASAGLLGSPSVARLAKLAPFFKDNRGDGLPNELPGLATSVPLMALQAQICDEIRADAARSIRQEDIEEFKKKMRDAKGEKEAAEKVIAEYVKKMRLENSRGESQYYDDRYSLPKDPGLKPAVDAGLNEQQVFASAELYAPQELGGEVVVWKTKHEPASTPELRTVRDEVRKAWQFREAARSKASAAAAKIRDEVNGKDSKTAVKALEKVLEQNSSWGNLIRLDDVTRQKVLPPPLKPDADLVYDTYKIDETDVAYPASNFIGDLLALKEKGATVLTDRPERIYYVAYSVKRMPEPTIEEALKQANRANLLKALEESQKKQHQQDLLVDMRRLAAKGGQLDARYRFVLEPGIKSDESSAE